MANLLQENISFFLLIFLSIVVVQTNAKLDSNYYDQTCPEAEKIIARTVVEASIHDSKVPARLLRMFFHDCFVRGCDASLLIDSTHKNKAEKDGPPNMSVRAYYVIDEAKAKLEQACPHTVSCADIIAIAARDAVAFAGGPYWKVLKGRKDGRISTFEDSFGLPKPSFNVSQLIESFRKVGLDMNDLVALSGAHSLGNAHCASFEARLRRFSHENDIDPSLDTVLAYILKKKCPTHNRDHNAGHSLDSTTLIFDNDYYKRIVSGKAILASDQILYSDYRTKYLVQSYAMYETLFYKAFVDAMVKLGNAGADHSGEVRRHCRSVN